MSEKTHAFIKTIINKNIKVEEKIKYRYDVIYNKKTIAIILCEDNNDFVYLIFDIQRYLNPFEKSCDIFDYYNTHYKRERKKCLYYIKKEINKYRN